LSAWGTRMHCPSNTPAIDEEWYAISSATVQVPSVGNSSPTPNGSSNGTPNNPASASPRNASHGKLSTDSSCAPIRRATGATTDSTAARALARSFTVSAGSHVSCHMLSCVLTTATAPGDSPITASIPDHLIQALLTV